MENKEAHICKDLKKRRFDRFICTVDIFTEISYGRDDEYQRAGGSGYLIIPGPEKQRAKVIDLSLGGAKVLIKVPINVGSPVAIRIEGSSEMPLIKGKAKIVWQKNLKSEMAYLAGIAFHSLGWRERFRLKRLIKRLSRKKTS
ncbi:MAG: PilZ domain-containing protein [Nitrospirae bacterium]|nr:PilZ domain-containing protein [Nitrospirota bacterium]